jgi:epoxyqueuosine reductase
MTPAEKTAWICERARARGFDLCGVADPQSLVELVHLPEWLERGYAGEMKYLQDPRRKDPRLVLDGVRSMVVVALNYNSAQARSTEFFATQAGESPRGWISRYAWGDDYHEVIGRKLEELLSEMRRQFDEPFETRAYVDTGPVAERVAAKHAGLGWLAKNTCLINEELGSWLFLGVILTTLELAPTLVAGELPPADLCGNCTLCLDACPTQAFVAPYVLDARRCISYLTIELRDAIPEHLREGLGSAVFGCDICQDVCPWNRKAAVTAAKEFQPREIENGTEDAPKRPLFAPELEWLAQLSRQDFSAAFPVSAIKRAKWRGMVRNACVAVGNAQWPSQSGARERAAAILESLRQSEDDLIAEHASWALRKLKNNEIRNS